MSNLTDPAGKRYYLESYKRYGVRVDRMKKRLSDLVPGTEEHIEVTGRLSNLHRNRMMRKQEILDRIERVDDARSRLVLTLYYIELLNEGEIGNLHHISTRTISNYKREAIKKIII